MSEVTSRDRFGIIHKSEAIQIGGAPASKFE